MSSKSTTPDDAPSMNMPGPPPAGPPHGQDSGEQAALRRRAEAVARENVAQSPESLAPIPPETARIVLHELRVHQIELEMQNEELRRAQEQLDAMRARYFDLYELAPVGYVTISELGLILESNLTATSLLGVTRSALIKQPFSRFIHNSDCNSYYLLHKQLIATGEPQSCDLRMVKQDGTPFWSHLEATAAQDAEAAPVCRVTLTDITVSKRAEEDLTFLAHTSSEKADESFFRALARYLAQRLGMDFVCIDRLEGDALSARTVAVWCDGHFEDNVSYALKDTPCGDVVGKTVCCFPASVSQFFPRDQVLQDLRAESYVGVTLWSHTGQPIGLIAVIGRNPLVNRPQAEATLKLVAGRAASELERLEAEESLRKSEEALRQASDRQLLAVRAGKVATWDWDIINDRLHWDETMFQLYGVSPEKFSGAYEARSQWVHPDDWAQEREKTQRALRGSEDYDNEFRVVWPDKSVHYIQANGLVQRDLSGRPVRMLGTNRDITASKLADAALQSSLDEKVALLNEVHHRVKNNLQVIASLLRLEARRSEHPTTKSVLKEMIGRILSMALLHESLYRSATFAAVDLGGYLKQLTTQSFRASVVRPGSIRLHLNLTSVQVEMDQALPCGLLVNELISNCLKHGFPCDHNGEVRVELQPMIGGPQLRLRVSDTGVGLPADIEAKLGNSLGLQLVSSLARQIDGRLEVGPGPGAVFEVIFTPKHSEPSRSSPPP